ncbi:unnamed protein product, partial [Rotaria sordida]
MGQTIFTLPAARNPTTHSSSDERQIVGSSSILSHSVLAKHGYASASSSSPLPIDASTTNELETSSSVATQSFLFRLQKKLFGKLSN